MNRPLHINLDLLTADVTIPLPAVWLNIGVVGLKESATLCFSFHRTLLVLVWISTSWNFQLCTLGEKKGLSQKIMCTQGREKVCKGQGFASSNIRLNWGEVEQLTYITLSFYLWAPDRCWRLWDNNYWRWLRCDMARLANDGRLVLASSPSRWRLWATRLLSWLQQSSARSL